MTGVDSDSGRDKFCEKNGQVPARSTAYTQYLRRHFERNRVLKIPADQTRRHNALPIGPSLIRAPSGDCRGDSHSGRCVLLVAVGRFGVRPSSAAALPMRRIFDATEGGVRCTNFQRSHIPRIGSHAPFGHSTVEATDPLTSSNDRTRASS